MYKTILTLAMCAVASTALAQSHPYTPETFQQNDAKMRQAQGMMNNPETQQQMQDAIAQMKARGMDTTQMEMMQHQNQGTAMDIGIGMNKCMEEKVGADGMNRIQKSAEEQHKKVKELCAAGKVAAAEKSERDYAQFMAKDKSYEGMRECGEKYKDAFKNSPYNPEKQQQKPNGKKRGVCD